MVSSRLLRLGTNQASILRQLLFDYLMKNEKAAKNNRIIRREYQIAKGLHSDLEHKSRRCKTCGQRIKT